MEIHRPVNTRLCALVLFAGALIGSNAFANDAPARQFKVIHSFCKQSGCADGEDPLGLAKDAAGNLYGVTYLGGASGVGTVFELSPKTDGQHWKYQVLHSFCRRPACKDTILPSSRLIVDVAGTLYGTTLGSNYSDYGVIYKLTPDTDRSKWKLSVLHRFNESRRYQDGFSSEGGLTYAGEASGLPYDGVSPLFGMTVLGGNSLMGIVYRLSPKAGDTGWSYKIIHDFCTDENCMDGEFPFGNLIVDAQQNLYGTTSAGGADGYSGTVFKLSPSAKKTVWAETVLYNFCPIQGCSDGMEPSSEVLMDATGNLFGTTSRGGATCDDQYGCGVAFKLTPSGETWKQKVLHTFCALPGCQDGSQPFGGMTLDAAGNLYGTTAYGGGNNIDQNQLGGGTVFQISGRHRVLHRFCSQPNCADGARPTDSLLSDGAGKLYGTTSLGGKYGQGTVFELTP